MRCGSLEKRRVSLVLLRDHRVLRVIGLCGAQQRLDRQQHRSQRHCGRPVEREWLQITSVINGMNTYRGRADTALYEAA
jgi:hypothetical protein